MTVSALAITHIDRADAVWRGHIAAIVAVAGAILLLFRSDVASAVQVWWIYPTYSHCFLIIPISAWLIWDMRQKLASATPSLFPVALVALPPILLVWLAANLATVNEVRQFAVVAIVQVALIVLLGVRVYRAMLFPALYLFFLVPFGQYLIPPMQQIATWFTDTGLTVIGVPHFTEGTTIELTNGRFEIAEACAGLRFLIATVALGVLFAHIAYRRWGKRLVFLLGCVVVPLIGNGLRCLGIIELAHATNNELATGADHLIYGWIFNTAIFLTLLAFGWLLRDDATQRDMSRQTPLREKVFSRRSLAMAAAGTTLLSATAPVFASWHDQKPVTTDASAITEQFKRVGWTARLDGSWNPKFNADLQLMTTITPPASAGGAPIEMAVEYYGRNRQGRSVLASTNHLWDPRLWHQVEEHRVDVQIGPHPVQLNEAIISTGSEQRLVWWSYWMDGTYTTSGVVVKLLQFETVFIGHEAAALIAFSTRIDGAVEDARAHLQRELAALPQAPDSHKASGQQAFK